MAEPLILTVTQRGKPGVYVGQIEGTCLSIRPTRHPMVDAAKALLLVGVDPRTVLQMRFFGSGIVRLSGPIAAAARLTMKEGREPRDRSSRKRALVRNFGAGDTEAR